MNRELTPAEPVRRALEAAGNPLFVQDPNSLAAARMAWHDRPVLGLDTEFFRERTYRAQLGLVQVSDGITAWLLDPLQLDLGEALAGLFNQESTVKVLHSASEDLEVLQHLFAATPTPLVDTQIAAALVGESQQISLQGAVAKLFQVTLDQGQTRSDWMSRPLRAEQLRYAASDVVFLPAMYHHFRTRLHALGRWPWLVEESERMCRAARQALPPDEAYRRIAGAGRLGPDSLRRLKVLAQWREEIARQQDIARGFVLPDPVLLQMAESPPGSRSDLEQLRGVRRSVIGRHGSQILSLIAAAAGSTGPVDPIPALSHADRKLLDKMRQVVARKAEALGLEAPVLASRRALEQLLIALKAGQEPPERFLGWRKAIITDELSQLACTGLTG